MSSAEHVLLSLLSELAFSFDGSVLGFTLAFGAVRSILKYTSSSAALRKIRDSPEVRISDLRSLIPASEDESRQYDHHNGDDQRLVIVRGTVKPKFAVDGGCKNNVLVSQETGDRAVIIERTQTYVYSGWKSFFQFTSGPRALFGRSLRKQEASSLRMVPFVIMENDQQPPSLPNFVVVNMDGSMQPLPLTTVYNRLQPINASPFGFLQAFLFPEYPVGLLDEEKILPPGKAITAVGICNFNNGVPEIKSCKDLPYFLSEMSKDKMILDLIFRTEVLFWSSVVMGCVSIGILGYAAVRGWSKWKSWKHERDPQRPSQPSTDDDGEDTDDIPDGQLCVVCLTRRRIPAFIPCGHIVCCRRCALAIERELAPKCPVCCQSIRGSMRVYYA
ncbi:PREDICTED: E3 ubiquitin-protein ligase SPL2-like [Tarenaya hassleriana]|uniref:E3 ubiquitin-protein ligase SPL2-like n=1 Tax=Tarenaya hassleriana TaxID=28532 RepID=UPI00053C7FBD|nr:PREDICTED: E3 ubiquitin-protein ligase SPL2-like [Tarenaya hassleriana]